MKQSYFECNELPMVSGYHNPDEQWNGFACPYFAKNEVVLICDLLEKAADTDESGELYRYELDHSLCLKAVYHDIYEGGIIVESNEVLPTEIDGEEYYPIGAYSWTWKVADEPPFRNGLCIDVLQLVRTQVCDEHPYTVEIAKVEDEDKYFLEILNTDIDKLEYDNIDDAINDMVMLQELSDGYIKVEETLEGK